ncbi:response regulator [Sorangium sp. So ce233]|uniref:response regulator n=1 Tax=Sorangium sp. So ce233 TaxID=3133290 RepID=UPI003F5F5ECC
MFVLLIDDDPLHLETLSGVLAAEALDVAIMNDSEEALAFVGQEKPDLILLDVTMPGIDGFELCARLKANPETEDIPVIFMTSLTETHHRVHGFRVGAVDYVAKPFEHTELLARVRTHLSLRSTARALAEKNTALAREIQERASAEQALSRALRELEQATEELRHANARLSEELHERGRADAARAALQEQIITVQRERLAELSTPLIPITGGILVMPLIGAIDVERASQVIEAALSGASERRARFLILDITGVKVVDATVAGALVQAARGLELLGTRAIITGVRPEVAQTLVRLDLRLDELVTKATLQAGVEYALRARRGN